MRRLTALILMIVLLWGCAAVPPQATAPSPMPGGENVGLDGNVWYLANETVEAIPFVQLCGAGDDLLLYSYDEQLELKLLSGEDLTLTAETTLEASVCAYVQVLDDCISVSDPELGTVTLLTPELEPLETVQPHMPAEIWFLSPDAGTLYAICDNTLLSLPLGTSNLQTFPDIRKYSLLASTGPQPLLEGLWLSVMRITPDRAIVICAGVGSDLVTRRYALELRTGVVTELETTEKNALWEDLFLLDNGSWLSFGDRELTLYDPDGSFRSRCALSTEGQWGTSYVWSERWQGWFFPVYTEDGSRLMFWDPAVQTDGASIDLAPETVPLGELLPRELYDRAEALSERFSIDIRIAERSIRDYNSYTSEVLTDPEVTAAALDVLEKALSAYPEGFFAQLGFDKVETIRFEIIDDLKPKSGADVSSGTSAFAQKRSGYYLVVLNGRRIRESVIFHELSHVIDRRLAWDAQLRPDALYSEKGWMALQPEGFEYAGSYKNIPESVTKYYDSGYFVRAYSCVSATEDRAMMMEKAMLGEAAVFEANPYLIPKLEYYCTCIRDSFATIGWPETLLWEQLLE